MIQGLVCEMLCDQVVRINHSIFARSAPPRVREGESSAAMKRYVKKKRDSSRHSFVRRALGAHQDSLDMLGTTTIINKG